MQPFLALELTVDGMMYVEEHLKIS